MTDENFSNYKESISTSCAFLTLVCLVLAPIKLAYEAFKLRRKVTKVQDKDSVGKDENPYAKFFADFKPNRASMSYVVLFFIRRYCLVLALVLLPTHRKFQISAQIGLTLLVLSYIVCV